MMLSNMGLPAIWLIYAMVMGITVVAFWKLLPRAGVSRYWAVFAFAWPLSILLFWVVAFLPWPEDQKETPA